MFIDKLCPYCIENCYFNDWKNLLNFTLFRNGSSPAILSPFFEMVPDPYDATSDFRNDSYLPKISIPLDENENGKLSNGFTFERAIFMSISKGQNRAQTQSRARAESKQIRNNFWIVTGVFFAGISREARTSFLVFSFLVFSFSRFVRSVVSIVWTRERSVPAYLNVNCKFWPLHL